MLCDEILFINIGGSQETCYSWSNTAAGSPFSKIDVIAARSFHGNHMEYVHLMRKENKLVFRMFSHPERGCTKLFLIVGARMSCQYQVMEAFIEFLQDRWFARFGNNVRTYTDPKAFECFTEDVNEAFTVVPRELIKTVGTYCRICRQNFNLHVKKSLVDNAESSPVPLVFEHANHAMLVYVDKEFHSRGEMIVNITG